MELLPQPEEPSREKNSPGSMLREASRTTGGPPNDFQTLLRRTAGGMRWSGGLWLRLRQRSALEPCGGDVERLPRSGDAVADIEDPAAVCLHEVEGAAVDAAHRFRGEQGTGVGGPPCGGGRCVESAGAGDLTGHEAEETVVVAVGCDVILRASGGSHFVGWEVESPSVVPVRSDVAEDIGELEGVAELFGVRAAFRGAAAEDADADEADAGGHPVAILPEIFPCGETDRAEIRADAVDDLLEFSGGDMVAVEELQNRGFER